MQRRFYRGRTDLPKSGREVYVATKREGVWYMKVILGLPDAAIVAQAG